MLDVDSCAAAYADRLRLDSPGMARPPPAASHQAGLGGRRNMDLGALAMPLEAGRGAGLGSPACFSLEDERSESLPSDAGPLSSCSPRDLDGRDDGMDFEDDGMDALSQEKGGGVIKRAWTVEEDQQLLQLVQEHGPRRWSVIASQLPGRVGKQCRERWHNHLCPSVNKEEWTEEEDQLIMELVQQMGTKWSKIVKMLPGRTDNAIKNRWNSTMRKNLRRQLKEQGGASPVFAVENVPARKRGSATSAEVATAAAAAAVNAAAAAASARGGPGSRSPGVRSPNNRSPINKRPSGTRKPATRPTGEPHSPPLVKPEDLEQFERQQQLTMLSDHPGSPLDGEESASPFGSPFGSPLRESTSPFGSPQRDSSPLMPRAGEGQRMPMPRDRPFRMPEPLRSGVPPPLRCRADYGYASQIADESIGLWSDDARAQPLLDANPLAPVVGHEPSPLSPEGETSPSFRGNMRVEMHEVMAGDWLEAYQGEQGLPGSSHDGKQGVEPLLTPTSLQAQLQMLS